MNANSDITFKTTSFRSILCDYSDAYILAKERNTIARGNEAQLLAARQVDEVNEEEIFEKTALFTKCISEISNALVVEAKYLDVVMPMYK